MQVPDLTLEGDHSLHLVRAVLRPDSWDLELTTSFGRAAADGEAVLPSFARSLESLVEQAATGGYPLNLTLKLEEAVIVAMADGNGAPGEGMTICARTSASLVAAKLRAKGGAEASLVYLLRLWAGPDIAPELARAWGGAVTVSVLPAQAALPMKGSVSVGGKRVGVVR